MSKKLGNVMVKRLLVLAGGVAVFCVLAAALGALSMLAGRASGALRVEEHDLYGAYLAEYENGRQKLTLNQDGRFVQEVTLTGSDTPTISSGAWKRYRPNESIVDQVDLENCLGVGDGFGRIRPDFANRRGGCSYPVGRRWVFAGQLRLGPDEASPLWKVS